MQPMHALDRNIQGELTHHPGSQVAIILSHSMTLVGGCTLPQVVPQSTWDYTVAHTRVGGRYIHVGSTHISILPNSSLTMWSSAWKH